MLRRKKNTAFYPKRKSPDVNLIHKPSIIAVSKLFSHTEQFSSNVEYLKLGPLRLTEQCEHTRLFISKTFHTSVLLSSDDRCAVVPTEKHLETKSVFLTGSFDGCRFQKINYFKPNMFFFIHRGTII